MSVAVAQRQDTAGHVDHCRRLANVLSLTKTMLNHADAGEWDVVARLEVERRDDLAICFSQALQAIDSVLVAEAIAALLHLNEELMSKLKVARDSVLDQGRTLSRQQLAASSYQDIGNQRYK
ncbi:MAG: flagellar protein FliT [Porticoccaceae bacterium]|nr:flagellar protein FliT [Pseudomonadales bacterium]MCP5173021.1 flagellar protein FliT [Pseudomonadales bacterium]MCP5302495.1 flagellar protein FliT [Pseudomonadales bacterium]